MREGERATESELRGPLQHVCPPVLWMRARAARQMEDYIYIRPIMALYRGHDMDTKTVMPHCAVGDCKVALGTYGFVRGAQDRMRLGSACGVLFI